MVHVIVYGVSCFKPKLNLKHVQCATKFYTEVGFKQKSKPKLRQKKFGFKPPKVNLNHPI